MRAFAIPIILFLMTAAATPAAGETIRLYNAWTDDVLTVEFKHNGRHVPRALERINCHLRDLRTGRVAKIDPGLIDLVHEIHRRSGGEKPIYFVSAFRDISSNRAVGGAEASQHRRGHALDFYVPDVETKHLFDITKKLARGGAGYYPHKCITYIHADTGSVRSRRTGNRRIWVSPSKCRPKPQPKTGVEAPPLPPQCEGYLER